MQRASSSDLPFEITPPSDTPEYMYPAYFSCLYWAVDKPEVLAAFQEDTGIAYFPPRNSLESAIDEATGVYESFFRAFVLWFNQFVWGKLDGPDV